MALVHTHFIMNLLAIDEKQFWLLLVLVWKERETQHVFYQNAKPNIATCISTIYQLNES
jgi:hypothetical protein